MDTKKVYPSEDSTNNKVIDETNLDGKDQPIEGKSLSINKISDAGF